MSRILVLSVIVASLSTIVGCGASARSTRITGSPASVNVAGARDDSAWNAPEEVAMSISASKETAPLNKELSTESYRPNRQERPTSGAVHAATY